MTQGTGTQEPYVGRWVHPESEDPLEMVGRKGTHDLDWLADYVVRRLGAGSEDHILDLACGNGLITRRMVEKVGRITGADYSPTLLRQAREISAHERIEYVQADARSLTDTFAENSFDHATINAAFQYFDKDMAREVLEGLKIVVKPGGRVMLLDIPDAQLRTRHILRRTRDLILPKKGREPQAKAANTSGTTSRFKSLRGMISYVARNGAYFLGLRDSDDMGYWWQRQELMELAQQCGFDCLVLEQPPINPHHTYRFDALLVNEPN